MWRKEMNRQRERRGWREGSFCVRNTNDTMVFFKPLAALRNVYVTNGHQEFGLFESVRHNVVLKQFVMYYF
jgi:hypothetical protein